MSLGERIKKMRVKMGLTQGQLADLCGWEGAARISNYEKNIREPNNNDIKKLASILKVDPAWLQFGIGFSPFNELSKYSSIKCIQVPLILWKEAADFLSSSNQITPQKTIPYPLADSEHLNYFALVVEGDAMVSPHPHIRSFRPGEIIVIDPERKPDNGNYVIAQKDGVADAMLKQHVVDAGVGFLRPLNPQYPNVLMDETVKICGVVITKIDYLT